MQKDLVKKNLQLCARCILGFLFVLSLILRLSLYNVQSDDYIFFLHPWYDFIRTHGSLAALKYNFADYNVVYLYLLALATYTRIPPIVAIKTLSVLFDSVIALFVYLILRVKYKRSYMPVIGALIILFTPTVFLNSAAWGQCDAMYTAFCLGTLYFLLRKRPALAYISFGIAFSFKLQAIFILPVLLVLFFKGKLPIKFLILIPAIYLLLLAPAFFEGRSVWSLLTIYIGQINENHPFLKLTAANFYQWFPGATFQDWKWTVIMLTAVMVGFISVLPLMSRKQITSDLIVKLTLVFVLVIPFFLPKMFDRYFYLADVVSIIYAFYFPRYWWVPVIEQLCSLISYVYFLFNIELGTLSYAACAIFLLIVVTLADLVKTLYPNFHLPAKVHIAFSNTAIRRSFDL